MIKKRFGEDFHASVADRLEIRQVESRKAAGDKKRRVAKGGKREGRPERKAEGKETQQTAQTEQPTQPK